MPRTAKPPLGVMPFDLWLEGFIDEVHRLARFPTLGEWLQRYTEVNDACRRYRDAGLKPNPKWITELLGL